MFYNFDIKQMLKKHCLIVEFKGWVFGSMPHRFIIIPNQKNIEMVTVH